MLPKSFDFSIYSANKKIRIVWKYVRAIIPAVLGILVAWIVIKVFFSAIVWILK